MLKLTTWNVNGIRAREQEVLRWVHNERPDVLCLQEVKASPEQIPEALGTLAGYWCYWHGHKGYSGVALHLAQATFPEPPRFAHPDFDLETRVVTAQVGDLMFASLYVPNGGRDLETKVRFLDALDRFAEQTAAGGQRLILAGDLNVAREERDVHPTLRRPRQIGQTPAERAQLERIIGRDLIDLSRRFQPEEEQLFTWWAPWRNMRQKNIGWRLDYVLASRSLAERAMDCRVAPDFGTSDHAPVTAIFDVEVPRGQRLDPGVVPPRAGQSQLSLFGDISGSAGSPLDGGNRAS